MQLICDNITNYSEDEYKEFFKQIKKYKQDKINKIYKDEDKKRSILGEILLIKLLNENSLNYNNIDVKINKYGKPYLKNTNLFYNISHSNDYVICAISHNEIGIDIEKIRKINLNTINQFTTIKEREYIANNNQKAFEIFSLKESYFKCIGTNLNNIKKIEFDTYTKSLINKPNYKFTTLYNIPNYIISTCEKIK